MHRSKGNYNMVVTRGQSEELGGVLWAESFPRGKQGACSVTNSLVKYRVNILQVFVFNFLDL